MPVGTYSGPFDPVPPEPDLVVVNASQVVTLAGSSRRPRTGVALADARTIPDGFVAAAAGRIIAVDTMAAFPGAWRRCLDAGRAGEPGVQVVDAQGRAVVPGFVDPHTHVVHTGDRIAEFRRRLAGATYQELAQAGGGILSTVQAVQAATVDQLAATSRPRLDRMLVTGTTTVEAKSGYGLTLEAEMALLTAIARLDAVHALTLVPTFLGAHAVPPDYRSCPDEYVETLVRDMLPAVAAAGLARFCDVFCDEGAFSVAQCRRVLQAARRLGMSPKVHADEFAAGVGGAELAAEMGAVSADHLLCTGEAGLEQLRAAGVVPVLLPGTALSLGLRRTVPARRLIEIGLPIALATDCNPGSCPVESMAVVMGLGCLELGLSPAVAMAAVTINAAHAIGLGAEIGSLEPGKAADLLVLSEPAYSAIPYRFGSNLVDLVIKGGRCVAERGRPLAGSVSGLVPGEVVE